MGPPQGEAEKTMSSRTPPAWPAYPLTPAPPPQGSVLTFLCSSLEDACIFPRGKEFKIGTVCFCGSRRERGGDMEVARLRSGWTFSITHSSLKIGHPHPRQTQDTDDAQRSKNHLPSPSYQELGLQSALRSRSVA